jgi:hypothetical protein
MCVQSHHLVELREHHPVPESRDGPQGVECLRHAVMVSESGQVRLSSPLQPGRPLRFEAGPLVAAVLADLAEELAITGRLLIDEVFCEPSLQVGVEV